MHNSSDSPGGANLYSLLDLLSGLLRGVELGVMALWMLTWPKAGAEAAPKAGVDAAPKAGVEPKPKPPWAGEEEAPKNEGLDGAPNAGVDAAPNAGVDAWPKGALACCCPKSPPGVCPKPPGGEAAPVFPLHPACVSGSSLSAINERTLSAPKQTAIGQAKLPSQELACHDASEHRRKVSCRKCQPGNPPSGAPHGTWSCMLALH